MKLAGNFFCIGKIFTGICNTALLTFGISCQAGISAMQNEPVVGIAAIGLGHTLQEFLLDIERCPPRCQSGTVCDPKNVGVDCDGGFAEGRVEDDIGRFAAHAGQ